MHIQSTAVQITMEHMPGTSDDKARFLSDQRKVDGGTDGILVMSGAPASRRAWAWRMVLSNSSIGLVILGTEETACNGCLDLIPGGEVALRPLDKLSTEVVTETYRITENNN